LEQRCRFHRGRLQGIEIAHAELDEAFYFDGDAIDRVFFVVVIGTGRDLYANPNRFPNGSLQLGRPSW